MDDKKNKFIKILIESGFKKRALINNQYQSFNNQYQSFNKHYQSYYKDNIEYRVSNNSTRIHYYINSKYQGNIFNEKNKYTYNTLYNELKYNLRKKKLNKLFGN